MANVTYRQDDTPAKNSQHKSTRILEDNRGGSQQTVQRQAKPIQRNNTGLPNDLKSGIEGLSGYSMDDVKVHYNSSRPAQLNAHAYAQGTDIHLASGQEKHLPHEAWHVVQQKQGRVRATTQMKAGVQVNDDAELEQEADVMGAEALRFDQATSHERNGNRSETANVIQRVQDLPENSTAGPASLIAREAVYSSYVNKLAGQAQAASNSLNNFTGTWRSIYSRANGFAHWMNHSQKGIAGSSAELLRVEHWANQNALVRLGDDDSVHPDLSVTTGRHHHIAEEVKSVTSVDYSRVGAQINAGTDQLQARANDAINGYSVFVEVAANANPWPYTSLEAKRAAVNTEAVEALLRIKSRMLTYIKVGNTEYYPTITIQAASGTTYSFSYRDEEYELD